MSIGLVMPSNHLILCCPLLLPSIFPSIRVFSNELALCIRWPKYWSFSFSIIPSKEDSGLISLGLTGLISLQSKGLSKVLCSTTSFIVQLSHQDETTRKTTLYNTNNKIKIFMSQATLVYIIYSYLKLYYKFTFFFHYIREHWILSQIRYRNS